MLGAIFTQSSAGEDTADVKLAGSEPQDSTVDPDTGDVTTEELPDEFAPPPTRLTPLLTTGRTGKPF